jgi:hypothetical protein
MVQAPMVPILRACAEHVWQEHEVGGHGPTRHRGTLLSAHRVLV